MLSEKDLFRSRWTRHESALERRERRKARRRRQRRGEYRVWQDGNVRQRGKRWEWAETEE